jgi:type III secretory pathway component EscT
VTPSGSSFIQAVADALSADGVSLVGLGTAWARVMPLVTLVPAFGLRALPAPARIVTALALACCILPAVQAQQTAVQGPWVLALATEAARGLPVAVAAAVPLYAATMAGGVVDALRGSQESLSVPTVEGPVTPLGVPMSLLAGSLFFAAGGPAQALRALALHPAGADPVLAAVRDISGGVTLAVLLAAPILAASVVVEVTTALIARAAAPAQVHALLAPLRAMGVLAALAVVLDRISSVLAFAVAVR